MAKPTRFDQPMDVGPGYEQIPVSEARLGIDDFFFDFPEGPEWAVAEDTAVWPIAARRRTQT